MKRINKYLMGTLLAGMATFTFTACDLDEYNPSGETADEVFVTPEGMEYLVNQMYYNFRWKYYGREDPVLYMEASVDIWQNIGNNYEYGKQMTRRVDLQGDRGQIANVWNRVYDNINDANTIINRLDNVVGLPATTKTDFDGEARFMRSYCYWWLVEFFGDIEMRTIETSTAEFTAYRTDRKVIYDEIIIPDARLAAEELPIQPYKGNVGRATKKAAKALLARVLLTRAQYEEAGSDAQKAFYQEALNAALDVINNKASYGISLYRTYDEIWQAKNNKTNTEFLWVTSHSSNSSLNSNPSNPNRLHRYFTPKLIDNAGITGSADSWEYPSEGGLIMPTYYFLNLWQDWDIRYDVLFQEEFPENNPRGSYTWTEAMANRYMAPASLVGKTVAKDATALRFTKEHVTAEEKENVNYAIVGIDDLFDTQNITEYGGCRVKNPEGSTTTTQYIAAAFPRFMKYRVWDREPNGTFLLTAANAQVGYGDVPVMRYAEMPLIAAECYIALGQTANAANIINAEIRNERVVKPGHSLAEAQVSASDMNIEWIMEERARELCGEWLRWFDVKRVYGSQGTYAATIRGRNPSMINDDCIQEFHTLWPIPNTFLEKLQNADEFGQNPGYNPYVRPEK